MQALGRILAADGPPAHDDYWYEPKGMQSAAGARVDMSSAITWSGMYAAVSYVAEDIAKVPLVMFERVERGKEIATDHYLHEKLHDLPNSVQDALQFREMMTAFAILRGAGIAEIRGSLRDLEIVPLHPDLVRLDPSRSGALRYQYRDPLRNGETRTILAEDLLILRGRLAKGIVDVARESVGLQLAIQRHAGFMFSRGARHQGVITRPPNAPWDDETRQAFREALAEYSAGGPREGRPLLLEDGMTWQSASMSAKDAELLGQMRWGITEASRWVRIPPHKLMELERSTNNNIDRQSIDYVVDTLLGWAKRWEQAIFRDLLSPADRGRFFAEHILDALMRGDPLARAQAYALAVQWGWMTRNEVRAKENLNGMDGLDDPLTPLNMTTDGEGNARVISFARPARVTDAVRGQLRLLADDAAGRVVRREIAAITKLAERAGDDVAAFRAGVDEFYREHASHVAEQLHVPGHAALRYARGQRAQLLSDGIGVMDSWLVDRVEQLTALMMDQEALAA